MTLMTAEDVAILNEINDLLVEATRHGYKCGNYGKSSEGAISLHWPPFSGREEDENVRPTVDIYSYMLGPHRSHYFESLEEALEVVKVWHYNQMSIDPETEEPTRPLMVDPYDELEAKRERENNENWERFEEILNDYGYDDSYTEEMD